MGEKILLCFGTRPEAIKMAPVCNELKKRGINFRVCVTGQHREMLDQVLDFFQIKPEYDLDLMTPDQSLNSLSSAMLRGLDKILELEKPDLVLVQGDTTTAFVAAFAAYNRKIKVGHIEAGLRTFNREAPFPEEGNRQLISRIADFHFVPTRSAKENLQLEGISDASILLCGNTVVDALELAKERFKEGVVDEGIVELKKRIEPEKKFVLITGHRRESFGQGLEEFCEAILKISRMDDVQVVFPVHMNPQVKELVHRKLKSQKNIILTGPVNYPSFLWLLKNCVLVISDSGGVQEEAPSFGKQVLVTREITERMEGVEQGCAFLVGTNQEQIVNKVYDILNDPNEWVFSNNPYGDGRASLRIVEFLLAETVKNS